MHFFGQQQVSLSERHCCADISSALGSGTCTSINRIHTVSNVFAMLSWRDSPLAQRNWIRSFLSGLLDSRLRWAVSIRFSDVSTAVILTVSGNASARETVESPTPHCDNMDGVWTYPRLKTTTSCFGPTFSQAWVLERTSNLHNYMLYMNQESTKN